MELALINGTYRDTQLEREFRDEMRSKLFGHASGPTHFRTFSQLVPRMWPLLPAPPLFLHPQERDASECGRIVV